MFIHQAQACLSLTKPKMGQDGVTSPRKSFPCFSPYVTDLLRPRKSGLNPDAANIMKDMTGPVSAHVNIPKHRPSVREKSHGPCQVVNLLEDVASSRRSLTRRAQAYLYVAELTCLIRFAYIWEPCSLFFKIALASQMIPSLGRSFPLSREHNKQS